MHPLRSSSKHSIVSLLVRRSRFFRFTSFSKKGTFFRTPWLQRLGLLVFPEDKPHFTTSSCFSVAHSAWSFLHTSFLLLPSKKKCQGERAYEVGTESVQVTVAGETISFRPRVTHIYHREAGGWKIVHQHTDVEPAMQAILDRLQASAGQTSS